MRKIIVVTKTRVFIEYLKEIGLVKRSKDIRIVRWADSEMLYDRDVIGATSLPLDILAVTRTYTHVPLSLPRRVSESQATLELLRAHAATPVTYKIQIVDTTAPDETIQSLITD